MKSPAPPALKLSFDAVFYYVTDLERSLNFYRNALDLRLVSRDFVARFDKAALRRSETSLTLVHRRAFPIRKHVANWKRLPAKITLRHG